MRVTLVRHATLLVELAGRTLLVDPMLDPQGARPAVGNTANTDRNPLVALPRPAAAVAAGADAIIVTHLHADHLDAAAVAALAKGLPLFGQPEDEATLREHGFTDVRPVVEPLEWHGITITRTGGRHGTGAIADMLAPVSGFVLSAADESLYVAGDTVWCDDVARALERHAPAVTVVNAGAARFVEGDPITMDAGDVLRTARAAPGPVVAVHLEAINHCGLSRAQLGREAAAAGADVRIPADGETLDLP